MAEIHGGQIAARQLRAAGIDTVFGVVAGPMIELFAGAQEAGLRVVGCRHEINGGFMAQAWGWQKKRAGVLIVGSGPALTNAITPLYVATASALPMVVLGGSAFGGTLGLGAFQELDQLALAKPACKWTGQVDRTDRIAEWIHLALGKAASGRPGGVYLDFPGHLVGKRVPEEQVALRGAPEITQPWPDPDAIARTADLLESAERPLLLIGKGAAWADAGPALAQLADLGIPYVTSPMARGTLPDDHPNFANAARSQALSGADVIVMFGGRFNWIFGLGRRFATDAKIVQVDVEAEVPPMPVDHDDQLVGLVAVEPQLVDEIPVIPADVDDGGLEMGEIMVDDKTMRRIAKDDRRSRREARREARRERWAARK